MISTPSGLALRAAGAALSLSLLLAALAPAAAQAQRTRRPAPRRPAPAAPKRPTPPAVPAEWRAALDHVSPASLRGHLSFIASDLLEGRRTPSRGLDIAAEYIAAQFRRAGLEPAGGDGTYFQAAEWAMTGREMRGFRLGFEGAGSLVVPAERASIGQSLPGGGTTLWTPEGELALERVGAVKVAYGDAQALAALTREQVEGRAVLTEIPSYQREGRERAPALLREQNSFLVRMRELGAAVVVSFDRASERGRGGGSPRLVDPAAPQRPSPFGGQAAAPLVVAHGAETAKFYDSLPAGPTAAAVSLSVPALANTPARVRNVAGVLRGSDPALRDEYVIVSAHYDHVGLKENCRPGEDCIFNGANDDGSGTVGVVELAAALSGLKARPKRSILFLAFFGEELGLLGSRYYGRNPLVPLARTVAQVNLEQVGRTDDTEGPQVSSAAVTGFDLSDVGAVLAAAGEAAGVRVFKHPTKSDAFFPRSDNQALADVGVPAHTVSTAYEFPDYHGVGDEWQKVDYENMARVLRAVGLGLLRLADAPQPPRWNESDPRTARYVEAWRKLHEQ
ncbi:MAG TPA: M28 family peptidase [Pyrinomonadaceae bacterium]|nr:M28 family peptidase [Pyrinomonadaceae bacterium]